jgi:hypothetical protein
MMPSLYLLSGNVCWIDAQKLAAGPAGVCSIDNPGATLASMGVIR